MNALFGHVRAEFSGTSAWELLAVALAIVYLLLAVRRNLWTWACALLSTSIYVVLMWRAALYMQTALQVFYLGAAVYGFIEWRRGRAEDGDLKIETRSLRWHAGIAGFIFVATVASGSLLAHSGDSAAPLLDSFVTWGSVVTTLMQARRILENWLYWVVFDGAAAALYVTQGLPATSVLMVIYVVIVLRGYYCWRKERDKQTVFRQTSSDSVATSLP
jgi:nicotinamide mononucleotide transporter